MNIHPFKALYPNMKMIPSSDAFFGVMKQEFPYYLQNSFFKRTKEPLFFLYKIEGKMTSYGLICSTAVEDILQGKILKHEHTIASKEQQMMDLALQRSAMIKPVLLGHDPIDELQSIYRQIEETKHFFEVKFKNEKSVHRVWKIKSKETQEQIQQIFRHQIKKSYIADGHHRVSTGLLLNRTRKNTKAKYGDMLSIYLSFNDLVIKDYSRIVSILKEISPVNLMSQLAPFFKISKIKKLRQPREKFEIIASIQGENYALRWKKKILKKPSQLPVLLDAELLNEHVFKNIFKITDVRNDSRLSYIGGDLGIKGVKSALLKDDYAVAFLLYPVEVEELKAVAEAGKTLPPKSTWFEPRIKNAIISQEFK